jgi:hypothetical protein
MVDDGDAEAWDVVELHQFLQVKPQRRLILTKRNRKIVLVPGAAVVRRCCWTFRFCPEQFRA